MVHIISYVQCVNCNHCIPCLMHFKVIVPNICRAVTQQSSAYGVNVSLAVVSILPELDSYIVLNENVLACQSYVPFTEQIDFKYFQNKLGLKGSITTHCTIT